MLPDIRLYPERHQASLEQLTARLTQHGYREEALHRLYGHHIGYRDGSLFPAYFWRLGSANNALGQLALLLLQRVPQERASVAALLGEDVVAALIDIGIFSEEQGHVRCHCDLHPRGEQYIFTDHRWAEGADKVYHLGGDSYLLPMFACYAKPRRLLDLCTGSGIQAISNGHAQELHLVDINPRALKFARLNLLLNGLPEKSHLHLGNLWEALPSAPDLGGACAAPPKPPASPARFDWISINPPFIPDFEASELLLFQGGGGSGEEITATVLQGAHNHLEIGGTLAVVTNAPERRNENQIAKLRQWLGKASKWGITHLVRHRIPRDNYIAGIIDRSRIFAENSPLEAERQYAGRFLQHLKHYQRHNIESMLEAIYLIEKLPADSSEWNVELELGAAVCDRDQNVYMREWQRALRMTHSADWMDHTYVLNGHIGNRLFTDTPLEGLQARDFSAQDLVEYLSQPRKGNELQKWGPAPLQQLAVWGALDLKST